MLVGRQLELNALEGFLDQDHSFRDPNGPKGLAGRAGLFRLARIWWTFVCFKVSRQLKNYLTPYPGNDYIKTMVHNYAARYPQRKVVFGVSD